MIDLKNNFVNFVGKPNIIDSAGAWVKVKHLYLPNVNTRLSSGAADDTCADKFH